MAGLPYTNRRVTKLGAGSRSREYANERNTSLARPIESQQDLSPTNQTNSLVEESSGLRSTGKKIRGREDREQLQKGESDKDRISKQDNNRRESKRTSGNPRKYTSVARSVLKSKGNPAALGLNLVNNKDFRQLVSTYKWPIFWGTLGELLDLIPFIGFVFNWICIWFVSMTFKAKGVNFVGKVAKGGAGSLINVLAEFLLSPLFFWPGLLIGVFQTIMTADKS